MKQIFEGWGEAARNWGWLVAALFIALLACAVIYTRPPAPHDVLLPDAQPAIPDEAREDHRGPDMMRGQHVGASPSKALPRPDSYLRDRGIKYGYYQAANWSSRSTADPIDAVTLHVTGAGTCPGMRSWFANPASSASAHFGVCKDGSIEQYVEMADLAWHNGYVNSPDLSNPIIAHWVVNGINPNRRTIGVEVLLAPGEKLDDYPAMKASLDVLMQWLSPTLGLPAWYEHYIGHNQVDARNRSVDPVCCYDVRRVVDRLWAFFNPVVEQPRVLTIEERIARIEAHLGIN